MDQNGTPATPWRFINLGTKPGGNEGARVALRAPPKSALDGLITCGSCGQPMVRDDTQHDQETSYACQPGPGNLWAQCQTPRLHARRTKVLLVRTELRTVLTEENISPGCWRSGKRPPEVRQRVMNKLGGPRRSQSIAGIQRGRATHGSLSCDSRVRADNDGRTAGLEPPGTKKYSTL